MFRFEMSGICFAFSVNSKARSLDLGTEQNVKVFTWLEYFSFLLLFLWKENCFNYCPYCTYFLWINALSFCISSYKSNMSDLSFDKFKTYSTEV